VQTMAPTVRCPRTVLVKGGPWLIHLLDGKTSSELGPFVDQLKAAIAEVGGPPAFLRTGHGSGKHEWRRTCYYTGEQPLEHHISALVEWSCMVDMLGLPVDDWAVREMLPLKPCMTLDRYEGMPVNKERRWFIGDGKPVWFHPYWPPQACDGGPVDWESRLAEANHVTLLEAQELYRQTLAVAAALPGAWSVDWMFVDNVGWYMIDAAPLAVSWVWPDWKPSEEIQAALQLKPPVRGNDA